MNVYDYKRAVNTLGALTNEDEAVIICIKHKNGQIVTRNIGDKESLKMMYNVLNSVPRLQCQSTYVSHENYNGQ